MTVSLLLCRLPFEQDVEQGNVAHLGDCDGKGSECVCVCVCVCPQVLKLMALLSLPRSLHSFCTFRVNNNAAKREEEPGSFSSYRGNPQINTETNPSSTQCSAVSHFSQE